MASPPLYTPELAEKVLQELRRGRTTTDVCTDPGMPCRRTVAHWVKNDVDGFAARYHEARRIGAAPMGAPSLYTPELAARVAGELASGRDLTDLCKDPGMPSPATVHNWRAEDRGGFAEQYRQAREIGRAVRGGPIFYSAELADRILGELMAGRTLIDVCDDPGMPHMSTVLAWAQRDVDGFAARYRLAREVGIHIMGDGLLWIGDEPPRRLKRRDGEAAVPGVSREEIDLARRRSDVQRTTMSKVMARIYGKRVRVRA